MEFARNVPLDRLDAAKLAAARNATTQPLNVICRSGSRGKQACQTLHDAGCKNVIHVEGGTKAWEEAGLPVVRGRQAISLERQVRVAAGALVLVGALLGYFVHAYWIGLSAFVGAGLVFAGVTDACGMAVALARMPWNRVAAPRTEANRSSVASCCR